MPPQATTPAPTSLGIGDIYYILFRHKWKILICSLCGFAAAAALYKLRPPPFQSDAKLFVRYVLSEKQISPVPSDEQAKSPDQRGETIMSSEEEILTSADLAQEVAQAVGPEKILAKLGGGKDLLKATNVIRANLLVEVPPHGSVIHLTFKHPDPEIVQPVLRELISRYMTMHREVHQSLGMLGDFLTQETDQLRARLSQTEDDLRKARTKAGIVDSVEDTKKAYTDQITALRLQLFAAQADLAEKKSEYDAVVKMAAPAKAPQSTESTVKPIAETPSSAIDDYRAALGRIDYLTKAETELLLQFTPGSARVKEIRSQLDAAKAQKQALEDKYPSLIRGQPSLASVSAGPVQRPAFDLASAAAQIAALEAKVNALNGELEQVTKDAANLASMEVSLSELRRRQQMEEENYRHLSSSLEQSRFDEALGNGHVSNISAIETPTPPAVDWKKTCQLLAGVAGAGIAIGLGWAFGIELYLDRTLKRPVDMERHVKAPLFIAIPDAKSVRRRRWLSRPREKIAASPAPNGALGESNPLYAFHETLRDRLIGFFESRNLTHKPKLVAVTSLGRNAGVTTTAVGLSQSLSEIGDSNVLLVDMTVSQGSARRFNKGKALPDLDEALERRGESETTNLFVVAADSNSEQLSRNLPQRFSKLVPKLKASDFDYILFDMPPVSQISITPRLAGFMDMVLLVIESEKTDRDLVQRATALLAESRAHVGTVLNKTRSYGASGVQQEFLIGA